MNGDKLTDLLKASDDPHLCVTGEELSQMIRENSTQDGMPHKITDDIRVFGDSHGKRHIFQALHLTDDGQGA